ncbi:MAG: hypothetical protein RL768_1008 [Nitrospirota bacterium]|jgi:hypothetical protein
MTSRLVALVCKQPEANSGKRVSLARKEVKWEQEWTKPAPTT